jgi:hypothetical protein
VRPLELYRAPMHLLAARLARGGVLETATAGKPCCYQSMQHASAPETPTGKEDFLRALFGRFGYSPTASGALKKDKRWLKVIIATTPYI